MKEEQLIKDTYAKDILDGKYPNILFWTYSASLDNKIHINKNKHRIEVPCDDSLQGTYQKTIKVLKVLKSLHIEYDYIFRTNCSTYINISLLNSFINMLDDDYTKIYAGQIYSSKDASGPYEFCFFGVGNSLLLPKYWCDILINLNMKDFIQYDKTPYKDNKSIYNIDDNAIGFMVNTYALNNNMSIYHIWNSFGLPEQNTLPKDPYKYIAIPYRLYSDDREKEFMLANIIHESVVKSKLYELPSDFLDNQKVSVINFEKHLRILLDKETAYSFIILASDIPKEKLNLN